MGTNYYRIPTVSEMEERKARLQKRIAEMEMEPSDIERNFNTIPIDENSWDYDSPWTEFISGANIHLGKRSGGWKFLWNFHSDKYFTDKESLFAFIRSGRIVNEYGEEINQDEFIEMALDWGQPDGWDLTAYYRDNPSNWSQYSKPERYVDGLRISDSTEFS